MQLTIRISLSVLLVILISACTELDLVIVDKTAIPDATATPVVASQRATPSATIVQSSPTASIRIEFPPNSTIWVTQGELAPGETLRFVAGVARGQQMSVRLRTSPASTTNDLSATLDVRGADGQALTGAPAAYWSGVVSSSQDYLIDVRSLAQTSIPYQLTVEIPAIVIDPALGAMYDVIPPPACLNLQLVVAQALGVPFEAETQAPFLDAIGGEAGQGCSLSARSNGAKFKNPQSIITTLKIVLGPYWVEVPAYQADSPTGSATALMSGMNLMLISVNWQPEIGVVCPSDQPIANCNLSPEQKVYDIKINVAHYQAAFTLDGQWEDPATNFNLELAQEWKRIYGSHIAIGQNGGKIDTLTLSIDGILQGKVATVQFQSAFTNDTGTAQITSLDADTIQWKIIDPPDGEYYLPAEAKLVRK